MKIHIALRKSSASASSAPPRSLPAMGWPEKACGRGCVVVLKGERADLRLGAAHISDELRGGEMRRELFHPVEGGVDGHGEENDVASRAAWMGSVAMESMALEAVQFARLQRRDSSR